MRIISGSHAHNLLQEVTKAITMTVNAKIRVVLSEFRSLLFGLIYFQVNFFKQSSVMFLHKLLL